MASNFRGYFFCRTLYVNNHTAFWERPPSMGTPPVEEFRGFKSTALTVSLSTPGIIERTTSLASKGLERSRLGFKENISYRLPCHICSRWNSFSDTPLVPRTVCGWCLNIVGRRDVRVVIVWTFRSRVVRGIVDWVERARLISSVACDLSVFHSPLSYTRRPHRSHEPAGVGVRRKFTGG